MNSFKQKSTQFFSLIRIKHWIKNLLIFAPLFFSGNLKDQTLLLKVLFAFGAFCFVASVVYIINDWSDKEVDRQDARKRKQRPIVAGNITGRQAFLCGLLLALLSSILLICLGSWKVVAVILTYLLLNIVYTFYLKKIPWVDAIVIVSGFVLRLLAGSYAIDVSLSSWILVLLVLLASYLVFSKRYGEVITYQQTGISLRQNIKKYNLKLLTVLLYSLTLLIIISYFLYSTSPEMRQKNSIFYLTNVFVIAGIVRYDCILFSKRSIQDPTDFFWKDVYSQVCIAGWLLSCVLMIY